MKRVVVAGNSGSGKTTLAIQLAALLQCEHIELDGIRHLPGWLEIDRDSFRKIVSEKTAQESWVLCGNASAVSDISWLRADSIVVFDLPRRVVMMRLIKRTIRRTVFRQTLWNGNRESLRKVLTFRDPHTSILAWAWTQHYRYRQQFEALAQREDLQQKNFYFVRNRKDVEKVLAIAGGRVP
jgi:adenylate kinase family enzyme